MNHNKKIIFGVLLAFPFQVFACTLSVNDLALGDYSPISGLATNSSSTIGVNCPLGINYSLTINSGINSANTSSRKLKRFLSLSTLNYNLYTDATYIQIWGDGTNGNSFISGSGSGRTKVHRAYGKIPANQNVRVGSYSDTLTVTLNF